MVSIPPESFYSQSKHTTPHIPLCVYSIQEPNSLFISFPPELNYYEYTTQAPTGLLALCAPWAEATRILSFFYISPAVCGNWWRNQSIENVAQSLTKRQLIACEIWDLLYAHHTCNWKELLSRTRWGQKEGAIIVIAASGNLNHCKAFARHKWSDTPCHSGALQHWLNIKQLKTIVLWLSGRALTLHAQGPKFRPWHLQLKQSGSRRCGTSLPETPEIRCQSEQTMVALRDQWEWMSSCQLLIEKHKYVSSVPKRFFPLD